MSFLKKDKKESKCPSCGLNCKTKEELEAHKTKAHATKLKCDQCGMTFKAKERLDAHVTKSHSGSKS